MMLGVLGKKCNQCLPAGPPLNTGSTDDRSVPSRNCHKNLAMCDPFGIASPLKQPGEAETRLQSISQFALSVFSFSPPCPESVMSQLQRGVCLVQRIILGVQSFCFSHQ